MASLLGSEYLLFEAQGFQPQTRNSLALPGLSFLIRLHTELNRLLLDYGHYPEGSKQPKRPTLYGLWAQKP